MRVCIDEQARLYSKIVVVSSILTTSTRPTKHDKSANNHEAMAAAVTDKSSSNASVMGEVKITSAEDANHLPLAYQQQRHRHAVMTDVRRQETRD
jgi:hypothetical protein